LGKVRSRLERWRARYGGPGRRIPEDLWSAAAEIARVEGVEPTARALRLREQSLSERVKQGPRLREEFKESAQTEFMELDSSGLCFSGRTLLLLESQDERVRVEVTGAATVDVIALARAFWNRSGCSS
jgi:hypothetical protein